MPKIQKKKKIRGKRETLLKRVATIDESGSLCIIIRSLLRLIKKITHNHSLHSSKVQDKKINQPILIKKIQTQLIGFLVTFNNSASLEPSSGS